MIMRVLYRGFDPLPGMCKPVGVVLEGHSSFLALSFSGLCFGFWCFSGFKYV